MNSLLTVGHDTVDESHVVATILVGDEDAAGVRCSTTAAVLP